MRNNLNNTLLSRSSGIIINSKIFFLLGGLWLLSSFLFNHPQITPIIISPEIEEIVPEINIINIKEIVPEINIIVLEFEYAKNLLFEYVIFYALSYQ